MTSENDHNQMLASTAYWIAAVRASESKRKDRLFNDPWAEALASSEGSRWIQQRSPDSIIPIVLRTRFFDDFLKRIISDNTAVRQIVLVGAGMDTRAFRMDWPEQTHFYELDQARILEYKNKILNSRSARPKCERITIATDLISDWEPMLKKAGFDQAQPSVWLLEGFLFYLSNQNLINLLKRVMNLAATGSYIGFDIINSITLTSPMTKNWVDMQAESGAPWIGSMDDPNSFFASHFWHATLTTLGAPEANYDRWPYPVIPATLPGMPYLWFVTAEKQ